MLITTPNTFSTTFPADFFLCVVGLITESEINFYDTEMKAPKIRIFFLFSLLKYFVCI